MDLIAMTMFWKPSLKKKRKREMGEEKGRYQKHDGLDILIQEVPKS